MYAEVRASETPAAELRGAKGLIISGGPSSVYDPGSPTVDPAIFSTGQAVLGICYGQQIMAHLLGGEVRRGEKGEYGMATLDLDDTSDPHVRRVARPPANLDEPSRPGGPRAGGLLGCRPHGHLRRGGHRRPCAPSLRRAVSPRGGPHCARPGVSGELRPAGVRLRARLGPAPSRAADRAGYPRLRRPAQSLLLRQRRRGFQRGFCALPCGPWARIACAASMWTPA